MIAALFVVASVAPAHAAFPASGGVTEYAHQGWAGTANQWFSTTTGACQNAATFAGFTLGSVVGTTCNFVSNGSVGLTTRTSALSCPAGSTLSGSSCTCTAPAVQNLAGDGCQSPDDRACDDASLVDSTSFGSRDIQIPGKVGTGFVCMPTSGVSAGKGCSVAFTRDASYQGNDGKWLSEGQYSRPRGGGSCTVATEPVPAPVPLPDPCKSGQPGEVNGVTVCIPFTTGTPTESEKKKETVTPSAGGPVAESTTSVTTCAGTGSCTTTTTTTTSVNGGTPTTSTAITTQGKREYCEANKSSAECGQAGSGGSKFGGSCVQGFIGEGDALQKATAEAVNKTNCLLDPGTVLDGVKDSLAAGTFGADLANTNRAIGEFDQTNPLGSTCPPDMTITVMSASVVIPFSQACWALQALGYIAVAFTLLYSTIFVAKGFN